MEKEIKCELCGETENLIKLDNAYITWICAKCKETKLGDKSDGYCSSYCMESGRCDGSC